jgi:hypothetical protein
MAGHIEVYRVADNCGCNSDMDITVTNKAGPVATGTVANGKSTNFNVPDDEYRVIVTFSGKTDFEDVTVSGNTEKLTATIRTSQMCIDSVKLCKK